MEDLICSWKLQCSNFPVLAYTNEGFCGQQCSLLTSTFPWPKSRTLTLVERLNCCLQAYRIRMCWWLILVCSKGNGQVKGDEGENEVSRGTGDDVSATMHVLIEVMAARLEGKLSILLTFTISVSFNCRLQKLVCPLGRMKRFILCMFPSISTCKGLYHLHVW